MQPFPSGWRVGEAAGIRPLIPRYFDDVTPEMWNEAIESCVPAKFLELNKRVFELGRKA